MKHAAAWLAGAICGLAWWAVSMSLARAYGVLGTHAFTGPVAGALTGIAMAAISAPVYRRFPVRSLLWFSPLSVYLSVALYGLLIFLVRLGASDFHPDQIPWAVGVQGVIGMWWGITFLLPIAVPVHLLAFANHRLLRRVLVGSSR